MPEDNSLKKPIILLQCIVLPKTQDMQFYEETFKGGTGLYFATKFLSHGGLILWGGVVGMGFCALNRFEATPGKNKIEVVFD